MGIKKGSKLKFKRKEQAALKEKGLKGCQSCGEVQKREQQDFSGRPLPQYRKNKRCFM